jgi:hypothetical protein
VAADFSKIVDHPEKTNIITKLVHGESPKLVAQYLKDKYQKPDEGHLRIPAATLQEFLSSYGDHHGIVKKIIQKDVDSKLDRKIADSLMDTRAWKERLVDSVNTEFDYIKELNNVITIIKTRTEQIFDLIQNDPENTKNADYIFTKYIEMLMFAIEKADKIQNDKPDIRIEHTHSVLMVEQHTVAFQEAIKRTLDRLGPDYTSLFMDLLNEEMGKIDQVTLQGPSTPSPAKLMARDHIIIDKISEDVKELESNFDEPYIEEEEDNEL